MKKTTKSIIQNVILGAFITLILLAFTVQAAPPVVTGDPGACGTDPFPAIHSPDYRIQCYQASPFDATDPTIYQKADWLIASQAAPNAQNQGKTIEGSTLDVNGMYGITREIQTILKGDNIAARILKIFGYSPYGKEGNDVAGSAVYVESTESTNPANQNETRGQILVNVPNAEHPQKGTAASEVRAIDSKFPWKIGYNIKPGSAEVGLSLGQSMLVRGPRSYEVYDDQGIHTFECNAQGQKCQRRKTEWFIN